MDGWARQGPGAILPVLKQLWAARPLTSDVLVVVVVVMPGPGGCVGGLTDVRGRIRWLFFVVGGCGWMTSDV